MKPSLSIVFFTVSSGAGLGLLALIALVDVWPSRLLPSPAVARGIGLALGLIVAGLASSALHLARPSNAWRAFARFRSSWLSREAVFAAALIVVGLIYLALAIAAVEDALRGYTTGGAYASFEENEKGSLAAGRLADLVIIDRDLTKIPPQTIRDAKVEYTIVSGRIVYDRNAPSATR